MQLSTNSCLSSYICYIFREETVDGPTPISIQTTPICPDELRERNAQSDSTKRDELLKRSRERKRERYAQMSTNEKQELLAKRAANQQKTPLAGKEILSGISIP